MRKIFDGAIAAIAMMTMVLLVTAMPAHSETPATRVLFIGNSMTNRNDMPGLFKAYVEAAYPGRRVETEMLAPEGESLSGHREKRTTLARVGAAHWDYVVLQDRGVGGEFRVDGKIVYPSQDPFLAEIRRYADAIRAAGAKPVLYEPPQSKSSVEQGPSHLHYVYMSAARAEHASIAPVDDLWRRLRAESSLELHAADGNHPSLAGSYSVAVMLATVLFGPAPENSPAAAPAGVSAQDAATIRAAVAKEQSELEDGSAFTLATPRFGTRPALTDGLALTSRSLVGRYRAINGGTRMSFGSEIDVAWKNGTPVVRFRETTTPARLELAVHDLERQGECIYFHVVSSNVRFDMEAALQADGLHVLASRDHREYRNVVYTKNADPAYFGKLDALYEQLDADVAMRGLASALPAHIARLESALGRDRFLTARQGFAVGEWDAIMTGLHYVAEHQAQHGLAYLRAAVDLYPASVDAWSHLGDGLAAVGARDAAMHAYTKAKTLNANTDPDYDAMLDAQIAALEKLPDRR